MGNRRNFLKGVGTAFITLQVVPLLAYAQGQVEPKVTGKEDSPTYEWGWLNICSGPSRFLPLPNHRHYVVIPLEFFKDPQRLSPKFSFQTSWAYGHYHTIILTRAQFSDIGKGLKIVVEDLQKDHHYAIYLPADKGTQEVAVKN